MKLSRRHFFGRVAAAIGSPLVLSTPRMLEGGDRAVHRRSTDHVAFDLHTHPGAFFARGTPMYLGEEGVRATVEGMVEGGLSGAFFSTVSDLRLLELNQGRVQATRAFEPGEAWTDYQRQIGDLRELMAVLPVDLVTDSAALETAADRGRVAAFLACEGGDCLEGRVDRLEQLHQDGVRSVQIVHYAQNDLGDLQTEPTLHHGLSSVGRDVVREMNGLGMVIDVAHASFETVRAVAEMTTAPLILSHSQLRHGDQPHPRLIGRDHARVVADTGGVIGMWPFGPANATFQEFVEQTLRLVDVVGVDHVGLGTDMDGNYMPVFSHYGQLGDWKQALGASGLTAEEVGKVAGGNALRVLQEIL